MERVIEIFNCLGLRVTYPVIKITDLKLCILVRFIPFHIFTQTSFLNSLSEHTCKTKTERYPPLYKYTLVEFSSKRSNDHRTSRTLCDLRELCRDCVVRAVTQELRTKHTDQWLHAVILSLLGELVAQVLIIQWLTIKEKDK